MAGLLDPQLQPYGLLGDIRQYTGAPSRAIGGLLDWYQSQPSVADRMASEYQGGQAAMDAAGQGLPERLKALAAYQRSIPVADSVAMDLGGMLGSIKAYHGSPHNFDRFDMSKIGTGEGAQAYGHGLYFAENEGVAQTYKGVQGRASQDPMLNVATKVIKSGQDPQEMLPLIFPKATKGEISEAITRAGKPVSGSMYEVNINAKPEDFLDWDKPLGQQPGPLDRLSKYYAQKIGVSEEMAREELIRDTGSSFYRNESSALGGTQPGTPSYRGTYDQAKATDQLRGAGIPGIKYLDGASRSAGDGSRNYVVFDDSLIQILRKYGLLPPAIAGAGLLASPEDALAAP
jgi:hypothetical protein